MQNETKNHKNIAVIGGSGFIGTRLIQGLLAQGYRVKIIDTQMSVSFPDLVSICDIRDRDALTIALQGIDTIYNLAAEHRDDVSPISLYYDVNVQGMKVLCEVAESLDIEEIIFTSSVAVYGFQKGALSENNPLTPFNDYGKSKLQAEDVLSSWQSRSPDHRLTIIRPTVVFGEGNRGNVFNLFRQIATNKFVMIGNGKNKKSMAYVGNIAKFLETCLGHEKGSFIFNYADKPDFDMNALVIAIRKSLGQTEKVGVRLPAVIGYLTAMLFDIAAFILRRKFPISRVRVQKFCANSEICTDRLEQHGFLRPYSLEDGLSRTLKSEFTDD